MSQNWFTIRPFEMIEGRRPAIFEAFDDFQIRVKDAFDDASDAIVAAMFGISGAVDTYAELPDPTTLDVKTIYIVRQNTGAPSGNGLYWVQESGGTHVWSFLDALNLQDASEVDYDNTTSGIPETNVQGAIDWLKAHGGGGGTSYQTYLYTLTATDIANKYFTLPALPATEDSVVVLVKEAPNQYNGTDYAVHVPTGRIMWNGLALDGVLTTGDIVTVIYQ